MDSESKKILDLISWAEVIVFDMNGLIVDDEPIQLEAVNQVIEPFREPLSESQWKLQCVGRKPVEYLKELLPASEFPMNKLQLLAEEKERVYGAKISSKVKDLVRPGFLDFFNEIVEWDDVKVALATSTTREGVRIILGESGLNLESQFDFIICGDEVSQAKPNPEIYRKVQSTFSQDSNFLVFEDSAFGLQSAVASGSQCIVVPNDFTIEQCFDSASLIIPDFTPILSAMASSK